MTTSPSNEHIGAWLASTYGLEGTFSDLAGELDLNLAVHAGGERYVLKIMRPDCDPDLVGMQVQAMHHLHARGMTTQIPRVLPACDGALVSRIGLDGMDRIAWLISWQPGMVMSALDFVTVAMAASAGRLLATVDRGLEDFHHPLLDRKDKWDLCHPEWISPYVELIEQAPRRALVERQLADFQQHVAPRLASLPRTAIYNDGNENNLFFSRCADTGWQASGLIDFGDMIRAPRVCEVAIGMAYAMLGPGDPVARGAALAAGYHAVSPLSDDEIHLLMPLARMRLAVSVTNSAMERRDRPQNTYMQVSEAPAWRVLEQLDAIDADALSSAVRNACDEHDPDSVTAPKESVLLRRRRLAPTNQTLFYDDPLRLVRGEGHFLFDSDGVQYLDVYNNVPHVGHAHPHVADAVHRQMSRLNTNSRYLQDIHVDYAERMLSHLPDELTHIVFVNSGSEANELALRLARATTGARDLLVMDHGYHGNTTGAMDISPYKFKHPKGPGHAPDWVHVVPQPDVYRGVFRGDDSVVLYIAAVRDSIAALTAQGRPLAGFISECVPSVGGQIVLPDGYLQAVYALVRAAGGVCIADDVQTSHGRLGHWFSGFAQQQAVPDVLVMGKPIGNGFPLAAVAMTSRIAEAFSGGPEFFSTFGGSSAACAAGFAVLDVLRDEQLQQRARDVGELMLTGLHGLARRHPLIGDVRGSGFFLGVDLVKTHDGREAATAAASFVKNELRRRHILLGVEGPEDNVLKIRPPMSFDASGASQLLDVLDDVLVDAEAYRLR